ncbi:MerR family transcriptional regulator [Lichenibacterium ramalinae]|uniref:MerR family transcriptional regulator n=2 Tax=Lichenibacterium ramalinae TaxID=2316527 RepID=A0A4Q2RB73_9HYPH|nr:MerR family transcriptional regulator [Lichenibacterium ramalinae]
MSIIDLSLVREPQSPQAAVGDGLMTIGDMAKAFNVSQRTLRFYEDRGMLKPKRDGSSRLYGAQDRRKLGLILRGKRLGFTLTEIIGFVADNGSGANALALDQNQINLQIAHLERQRESLDTAISELRATQDKLATP